ncbi:hypothetical protein J2Z44_000951 [Clostridium punense]|uniref:AlgX/AlgJ SGNH hydrolase-like domain-containing protein n=1 Tax=Clostridium punense TaxID=1054297 RepID=A0ABS4K056_9CLOT|nr:MULTISPECIES: DHHW family protein [Clostridium]EQB88392.1 hypothetical protein M918_04420 [Clostridium sp. BL8]MBP2021164.1 hypothetical protein [Clostridium punense]
MKKIYSILLIITFVAIFFAGGILTFIQKDEEISKLENRKLAMPPVVTKEKLIEGTVFSEFDEYIKDQFIYRGKWIKANSKLNTMLNKKKYVDVVVGKDGYLLSFNGFKHHLDEEKLVTDVDSVATSITDLNNKIQDQGGKLLITGLPGQSYINSDKYEKYFESMGEFYTLQDKLYFGKLNDVGIKNINMKDVFNNYNENLYYKTDHHYNFKGAYLTYSEIINSVRDMGYKVREPYKLEELNPVKINKPFHGSWGAKMNYLFPNDDFVEIPNPKFTVPKYEKIANGNKDNRLYYFNKTDEASSYAAYMNGDNKEVKITTDRKELPKVLIFGDSFTNGIEPLLWMHFNETRILDLRYYKDKNLYKYIEEYKPDLVIYVLSSSVYTYQGANNNFKGDLKD